MSGNSQPQPESILIVRLGAMGDVLHAMPAVAMIRKASPQAKIGWVVEKRWSELIVANDTSTTAMAGSRPLIDILHTVDTRAWRKNLLAPLTWHAAKDSIRELRSEGYNVAIDFQGALKSALLARLSGAQRVLGFAHPRESVARLWYTSQVKASAAHVIDQNLQLASAVVSAEIPADPAFLPTSLESDAWCTEYLRQRGLMHFAMLNPGSGWGAKCWPAERYAEVAKRLSGAGLRSLINYGPGEEELADAVAKASAGTAETVRCTLSELIALTRRASLFIGGDTGPMHLAAALRIPTIALFGPTDPARNGPYWSPSTIMRSDRSVTSYKHVAQADAGLHSITSEAVVGAAAQILGVPIG